MLPYFTSSRRPVAMLPSVSAGGRSVWDGAGDGDPMGPTGARDAGIAHRAVRGGRATPSFTLRDYILRLVETTPDMTISEMLEGREQCRRAMTLVVVGHRPGAALLHRQAALSAVRPGRSSSSDAARACGRCTSPHAIDAAPSDGCRTTAPRGTPRR